MISLRHTAVAIFAFAASGCVAVDSRASREVPAGNSLAAMSAQFVNSPSYTSSKFGFAGPADLGELFGAPNPGSDGLPTRGLYQAQFVGLTYTPDRSLRVQLLRNKNVVAERELLFGRDFSSNGNRLYIKRGGCGGADTEQLGCAKNRIELFINNAGDLVIVEAGGGAGLVTVLPFAMYAKLMSIFPRVQ